MKVKAIVVVMLLVVGLTAFSIGNAQAGQWYTCTISKAGAFTSGADYIMVSDVGFIPPAIAAFTNTTFILDNSSQQAKSMMAAALTALANSTYVEVYLETVTAYSVAFGVGPVK